jgi:hypothetical protein
MAEPCGGGLLYFAEYTVVVKAGKRWEFREAVTTSRDGKISDGEDFQTCHPAAGDRH